MTNTTRYPIPDRSSFNPNQQLDDPVQPGGDIGAHTDMLADERPYVQESWYSEGYTFATFFFSTLDLEDSTPESLLALLADALEEAHIPSQFQAGRLRNPYDSRCE